MFDLIKELTELPGPVGQEEVVLAHMEALWPAHAHRCRACASAMWWPMLAVKGHAR